MSGAQICVIRRFRSKDQSQVKELMSQTAMERFNDFFFGIVFSQTLVQVSVTLTAILFIIFSVPLMFSLVAFPLTIGVIYVSVYVGHLIKVSEINDDLQCINNNYMNNEDTCFFVAEVYVKIDGSDVYDIHSNKVKKVEYEFVTEKEFEVKSYNLSGLTPIVAGCIAVTKSFHLEKRAQIRRFTVLKRFRRRHIGTELLNTAMKFSIKHNYIGLQAVLTEYHQEAFELFVHENFDVMPIGYKSYLIFDEVKQISVCQSFAPKKDDCMDERKSKAENGEL